MHGAVSPGASRWRRLRPCDAVDLGLIVLAIGGLALTVIRHAAGSVDLEREWLSFTVSALLLVHGSTPVLAFFAAALYLTRWGRTVGRRKIWVWAGVAATFPLWFLAGLPIGVRGLGDITFIVVPWNLIAAGIMAMGVAKTLRGGSEARHRVE